MSSAGRDKGGATAGRADVFVCVGGSRTVVGAVELAAEGACGSVSVGVCAPGNFQKSALCQM